MADRAVTLETAAFLDSPRAAAVAGLAADELRALVQDLVAACYEDLGKAPRLLDGEDVRALLQEHLVARMRRRDPRAPAVGAVLEAFFEHQEETHLVPQAYEIRAALAEALPGFLRAVEAGEGTGRHVPRRSAPFVHRAEKLGRNDPCSCGSGRKYKKCHGRGP